MVDLYIYVFLQLFKTHIDFMNVRDRLFDETSNSTFFSRTIYSYTIIVLISNFIARNRHAKFFFRWYLLLKHFLTLQDDSYSLFLVKKTINILMNKMHPPVLNIFHLERLQLRKGNSCQILLLCIVVVCPGFKFMPLVSIRMKLKFDLYLFKWMADRI